ncbi:MAG: hypothetical protein AB8C95_12545 [Phycisphaeraceae bacterium]
MDCEKIDREGLLQDLGEKMSAVSEDCYYAGWMEGTEYFVPELCQRAMKTNEIQPWGHGEVTPNLGLELSKLAELIGHWADLDEIGTGYIAFDPFPIPKKYRENIDHEMKSKRGQSG